MKTKRMKKLMMGQCGLSRNQVNRMVKEQRTEGSPKVSNEVYYRVFKKDLPIFTDSCGGEILPYMNSFVLK